jgi:hypothetical protein
VEDLVTARGRALAFRILAAVFGLFVIVPSAGFAIASLVSSDPVEQSHRVHTIGALWGFGLTGAVLLAIAIRPANVNAFQAGLVASVGMVVVGLVAGDLVSGFLFVGLVGTLILFALHPHRREALSFSGRPSLLLIGLGVIALVPAGAYSLTMAELQGGPATDPHVEMHHWSGMAAAATSIVLIGIVAGLRTVSWRPTAWLTAGAGILFGLTSATYPDLPSAVESPWIWLTIAWSLVFAVAAGFEGRRVVSE